MADPTRQAVLDAIANAWSTGACLRRATDDDDETDATTAAPGGGTHR